MNICYTYYENIEEINNGSYTGTEDQKKLIDICRNSWERAGWRFVVLNETIAQKHFFYKKYKKIISTFPTINPKKYEYNCFMRWLAMSQIGGGLVIDYDVININFYKKDIVWNKSGITVYQGHVPCVVYGTSKQYFYICKKFCEIGCLFLNKEHVSDMELLGSKKINFNKLDLVSYYPNLDSKLVHCCYNSCKNENKTKYDAMKEICE